MCIKYPWVRYAIGRKELKRLKQSTLASYFKFVSDYNIPEKQRWMYNAQDSKITFANGSEILLLDLAYQPSDPLYTRLWSTELTWAFVDEAAEVDEQCITILSTRIWRQNNEKYNIAPKLLQCFNPDKWHVYRKFYKPYKDWSLPDYRVFIPALATDNEFVPKSYIEQLEKADEVTKQRLLYGNFDYDDTPWRLFDFEALNDMFTNPRYNWEKIISVDVAREWNDNTVICIWDWLEILEIISEAKSRLDELSYKIRNLSQKYWVWSSRIIVDENWVWWWLVDSLRCQGFINNARPVETKSPNMSQKRNFDNLKTQCYYELSKLVNDRKIRINTDQSLYWTIIEELDVIVQVDLDKDWKYSIIKKDEIKQKIWRSPDYSDAIMMRMFYELRKTNLIEDKEEKKEYDPILDDDELIDEITLTPY